MQTILPDENDIRKPMKVDADTNGEGGDDFADMFRYGIATRVQVIQAQPGKPLKRDDHAVRLDPKTKKRIEKLPEEAWAAMLGEEPAAAPQPRPQGVPRW